MLRKMVNSMSAKMEIGSPMASMYILGYPDYYASHKYEVFAWRPYFIASSGVDDYRYRPIVYGNVNLYEWIQCAKKKKRTWKERETFEEDLKLARYLRADYNRDAMKRLADEGETGGSGNGSSRADCEDDVSDWETDDEDEVIVEKQDKIEKARKPVRHAFLPKHDLFLSHSVICDFENITKIIPNFIGGALPRSDKGDRAAYCMTMLVLFKPWRSPADLKDAVSTWDQAFKEHEFSPRQKELLQNFNVRYECNDARDDHFAQMKKK
ncbi:hypothetical protein FB451DRAFT_1058292, partial [Mycena latifolia]